MNRNLTQFRPSEIQCKPSPMARNDRMDMRLSENVKDLSQVCFDRLENHY